MIEHMTTVG